MIVFPVVEIRLFKENNPFFFCIDIISLL